MERAADYAVMRSRLPGWRMDLALSPFHLRRLSIATPNFCAIPNRVSPARTVYNLGNALAAAATDTFTSVAGALLATAIRLDVLSGTPASIKVCPTLI